MLSTSRRADALDVPHEGMAYAVWTDVPIGLGIPDISTKTLRLARLPPGRSLLAYGVGDLEPVCSAKQSIIAPSFGSGWARSGLRN